MRHIDSLCSRISKSCEIIWKPSHFILRSLYLILVYPHILYGIHVWGTSNKAALYRLQRAQDRCIKIIHHSYGGADVRLLFKQFKLLRVIQIYEISILCKFYEYYCTGRSIHCHERITANQVDHQHGTRLKIFNKLRPSRNMLIKQVFSVLSCQWS